MKTHLHINMQWKGNVPTKSSEGHASPPPEHFVRLNFWAGSLLCTICCQSLSILCVLALCVSLWPNLPPFLPLSLSLTAICPPFFSSFVSFSSHSLSHVATWPVDYFPETLLALWLLRAVKHTHMQVQQGRSKVRRGHKFPSDPLCLFPTHTQTPTLSHSELLCRHCAIWTLELSVSVRKRLTTTYPLLNVVTSCTVLISVGIRTGQSQLILTVTCTYTLGMGMGT